MEDMTHVETVETVQLLEKETYVLSLLKFMMFYL